VSSLQWSGEHIFLSFQFLAANTPKLGIRHLYK
jgi:hypothetical protein